jgi:hypothetical protein
MLAIDSLRRLFQFRPISAQLRPLALPAAALLLGLLISSAQADTAKNIREIQLAAAFQLPQLPQVPGLPALTGPSADWRQFDSFFTFVVKRFGDDVPANLKDPLGDAFLDSPRRQSRAATFYRRLEKALADYESGIAGITETDG